MIQNKWAFKACWKVRSTGPKWIYGQTCPSKDQSIDHSLLSPLMVLRTNHTSPWLQVFWGSAGSPTWVITMNVLWHLPFLVHAWGRRQVNWLCTIISGIASVPGRWVCYRNLHFVPGKMGSWKYLAEVAVCEAFHIWTIHIYQNISYWLIKSWIHANQQL